MLIMAGIGRLVVAAPGLTFLAATVLFALLLFTVGFARVSGVGLATGEAYLLTPV